MIKEIILARNRMIRPEFWEDTKIASLTPYARLFYIALWNFSDDEGYLENNPLWLKAKCFPYDNVKIDNLLKELLESGRILIKNNIILIINFRKYQRIDRPAESALKEVFGELSTNNRRIIDDQSPPKEKLKQDNTRGVLRGEFKELLSFYNQTFQRDTLETDSKYRKFADRRLKFSLENLKTVICNVAISPFHRGENDRHREYIGWELLFRSDDKTEEFLYLKSKEKMKVTDAANLPVEELYAKKPRPNN